MGSGGRAAEIRNPFCRLAARKLNDFGSNSGNKGTAGIRGVGADSRELVARSGGTLVVGWNEAGDNRDLFRRLVVG